jgi:hypothetical protein
MAGASQEKAEMRIPSLRGQLRWWHRNLGYPSEYEIFGGTNGSVEGKDTSWKSSVTIREHSPSPKFKVLDAVGISGNPYDYFLWPLRKDKRGVIDAGTEVTFSTTTRTRGYQMFPEVIKAFLLLGAMGSRSRRCYGSVWPVNVVLDDENWRVPGTETEFIEEIETVMDRDSQCRIIKIAEVANSWEKAVESCAAFLKAFRCGSHKSGTPSPWGQNDHDIIKGSGSVYRQALGLPLKQRYSRGSGSLNSIVEGVERLPSPVHFKVIPLENGFLPVGIIFMANSLADGTKVLLQGEGTYNRSAELDLELLHTIADPTCSDHQRIWNKSSVLADFV